jgi:hypothetical protein
LVYLLTAESLTIFSWWGLGRPEKVTLKAVDRVEVMRSLAMTVCGCGHIIIRSHLPDESSLTLLAQPRSEALAHELRELSAAAGSAATNCLPNPDQAALD